MDSVSPFQITLLMQLLEPLMHWSPFHFDHIRNPPCGHCWELGFANHPKDIVITRFLSTDRD
ncbi:hypothetical protein HAL_32350 [Haladaptatus sp. T7]|nr:hypothetical protein HAL_32350 [Haladaptatus sp. T7]